MILRRFMKHVSDQNWFAVGLDVIVVITGIFLGMQVTDWNEARQERNLQSSYYRQLILDLEADQEEGQRAIDFNNRNYASGHLLFQALTVDDYQVGDPLKFADAVMRAGFLFIPQSNRQTFNELTSTGNLRLLDDVELKRQIVGYYSNRTRGSQWNSLGREIQLLFREQSAGLVTPEIARKIRSGEQFSVDDEQANMMIQKASNRPELRDLLTHLADFQEMNGHNGKEMIDESRVLAALIQRKL